MNKIINIVFFMFQINAMNTVQKFGIIVQSLLYPLSSSNFFNQSSRRFFMSKNKFFYDEKFSGNRNDFIKNSFTFTKLHNIPYMKYNFTKIIKPENAKELFQITTDTTFQEVKSRYYKLAQQYHPDKEGGNLEKFKEISNLYELVNNEEKLQSVKKMLNSNNSSNNSSYNNTYNNTYNNSHNNYSKSHTYNNSRNNNDSHNDNAYNNFYNNNNDYQKKERNYYKNDYNNKNFYNNSESNKYSRNNFKEQLYLTGGIIGLGFGINRYLYKKEIKNFTIHEELQRENKSSIEIVDKENKTKKAKDIIDCFYYTENQSTFKGIGLLYKIYRINIIKKIEQQLHVNYYDLDFDELEKLIYKQYRFDLAKISLKGIASAAARQL